MNYKFHISMLSLFIMIDQYFFENILKEKNIKITNNRLLILNCLNDEKHFHTLNMIKQHIKKKYKKEINIKTLYNNIKILYAIGIIESFVYDHEVLYALVDSLSSDIQHMHIIDYKNKKIDHMHLSTKTHNMLKKELDKKNVDYNQISITILKK